MVIKLREQSYCFAVFGISLASKFYIHKLLDLGKYSDTLYSIMSIIICTAYNVQF